MGFRFRKSINVGGGFRINLSKSGVGYSFGVPGYRITKTATGRTRKTISIPGTGISYVEETKKNSNHTIRNNINNSSIYAKDIVHEISSAPVEQLQSVEHKDLINNIETLLKLNNLSNILLFCVIFLAIPGFFILPIVGLILKILIAKKWRINLDYNFEDNTYQEFENKVNKWLTLNQSSKKWQLTHEANVTNKKANAGASSNVRRVIFKVSKNTPYFIKCNITPVLLELKKEKIFIFPDKILILSGNKIGALSYNDLQIDVSQVRFIERDSVPKDSKILSYTWAYVNKNGSPDKRYKNNRQLPICQYGSIEIKSKEGLNISILISNLEIANNFKKNSYSN